MMLPPDAQAALDRAAQTLQTTLGANLASLVLYGSAVRGNFVAGKSDLNLLIVLVESTPEAHAAVADALRGPVRINPLIVGRRALDRTLQSFALKFRSIRRSYRVLHGPDPLAVDADPKILRFLCEQALRNRAMRLARAFVVLDRKHYTDYLLESLPGLFTDLAEPLRLEGADIPQSFAERIPALERGYDTQAPILQELLDLRARPRTLDAKDAMSVHAGLYRLLDRALHWVETRWP